MSGPFRSILPVVLALLILVIIALGVALFADELEPEQFEPGTPEAAVQDYILALDERDIDHAYELLSESARDDVSRNEFRDLTRPWRSDDETRRIRLTATDIDGARARVTLDVETAYGTGINRSRYTTQNAIPLVRENGEWKIDDPYVYISDAMVPSPTG